MYRNLIRNNEGAEMLKMFGVLFLCGIGGLLIYLDVRYLISNGFIVLVWGVTAVVVIIIAAVNAVEG